MKTKLFALASLSLIAGILPACSKGSSNIPGTGDLINYYTVTFNPCNGDAVTRATGQKGDTVAFPTKEPKASGKVFAGWSTKYSSSKKSGDLDYVLVGSNYQVQSSNVVLYAAYQSAPEHTEEEVNAYMDGLLATSQADHLYYHYYRFDGDYSDWDVWAWAYKPDASEGAKFNFLTADDFGGAYVDIDLNATYDGGWDSATKTMGGTEVRFVGAEQMGLQIVKTSTRQSQSGFWTNDGSNLYVALSDYEMELPGGGKAHHIFVVERLVQEPGARPATSHHDPFEDDDGTNTTFSNSAYDNVNWSQSASTGLETSSVFQQIGAGYQIMVSSFADSDEDGTGDIYGITQKLDYLEKLGVKALWLTPIQLSDSYHGYDITDYEQVDPKFGSSKSPNVTNGAVTSETALKDYQDLINAAHAKGMKIVMDLVLNHTSTSNKWFTSSANLDDDYRGYYQWGNHNTQPKIKEANNWYPYGDTDYSYYAKFGSAMPELNFSFKSTREAVEEMSVYWAKEIGVDGFRLDAVKHIYMENEVSSTSGDSIVYDKSDSGDYSSDLTKNIHFFKELKSKVTELSGKNIFFVGENFDGHAYHVAPYYQAFDSLFDFYTYFNLTSAAATGLTGGTSAYGTASKFMKHGDVYSLDADKSTKDGVRNSDGMFNLANNKAWNFPTVYSTYNSYRGNGQVSLPGVFTSNHDIARVINRIAGTGTSDGLQRQGTVTETNFNNLSQSANCVKIASVLFPGVTWIYYGDEIGMTGNFPSGKDANSDYADLYYRQPMKWVQDGSKGDEYGTTDYYVTGSQMKVEQDEINKSSLVTGALAQANSTTSNFANLAKFVKIKNASGSEANADVGATLRLGSFTASDFASGNLAANVLSFTRSYNGTTVKVAINFNTTGISANSLNGTVIETYNGATQSYLPAFSAIVVKA